MAFHSFSWSLCTRLISLHHKPTHLRVLWHQVPPLLQEVMWLWSLLGFSEISWQMLSRQSGWLEMVRSRGSMCAMINGWCHEQWVTLMVADSNPDRVRPSCRLIRLLLMRSPAPYKQGIFHFSTDNASPGSSAWKFRHFLIVQVAATPVVISWYLTTGWFWFSCRIGCN